MGQHIANGPISKLTEKAIIELFKEKRKIYSRLSLLSPENTRDSEWEGQWN